MSGYLRKSTVFQFNFLKLIQWLFFQCLFCARHFDFENVSLKVDKMGNPNSDCKKWGSFLSFAMGVIRVSSVLQMFLSRSIRTSYLAQMSVGSSAAGAQEMSLAGITYKK